MEPDPMKFARPWLVTVALMMKDCPALTKLSVASLGATMAVLRNNWALVCKVTGTRFVFETT